MKKRIFLMLGMLCMTALCAIGFAACGEEHVHDWGEWTVDKAATCEEAGYRTHSCTVCGEEAGEEIEPLAHSYVADWTVVEPATCLKEGKETNVCELCGNSQERAIPLADHTYGQWYDVKPASCSEEGLQRRDCIVCNEAASDDFAFETQPVNKLNHTPRVQAEVPANCLDPGRTAGHDCALCGEILDGMTVIEALGHDLGEAVNIKQSTCTDAGVDRKTCRRDGCEYFEETFLPLADHIRVPDGENKDATCESAGLIAGEKCDVCGKIFKEKQEIPQLEHELGPVEPFESSDGAYWHHATCTRPGCMYSVLNQCEFELEVTPATCTANEFHHHYCKYCTNVRDHEVEDSALGHNYSAWFFDDEAFLGQKEGVEAGTRRHFRICTNSGHVEDPEDPDIVICSPVAGDKVDRTCTTAGYTKYSCADCHNEYTADRVEAAGHTLDGGYQNRQQDGHWVHFKICSTCEEECELHACTYDNTTTTTVPASCLSPAKTTSVCKECSHTEIEEHGAALGHSYGNPKHDDGTTAANSRHYVECLRCHDKQYDDCTMESSGKVPTCQAPGEEIQICSVCKYTESKYLEKVQHQLGDARPNADGTHTRHSQTCSVCHQAVFETCSFEPSIIVSRSCTTDEKTKYECPVCHDSYTVTTAIKTGHVVNEYTAKNKAKHTGECIYCHTTVEEDHNFTTSNLCASCGSDGLTYAYVDSSKTRAKLTATIEFGIRVKLNMPYIEIPEMVDVDGNGSLVPVVAIGINAFFQNPYVREVVLPKTIETIEYNAFDGCIHLQNVRIAGHNFGDANVDDCALKRIESDAFRGCTSLTQAILPATLIYIGPRAFENCASLADINLPKSITEIQDYAFRGTAYYNDISHWESGEVLYIGPHLIRAKETLTGAYTVAAGTVSISADAFKDCSSLTRITLPAELKVCDSNAFLGCTALDAVVFEGTFADYVGIRFDNDAASPMHYASTLNIKGAQGAPQLPETATAIPAGTFRGSSINSITIPASVTSIGSMAFAECSSLETITFAEGSLLRVIGEDVVKDTPFYNNPDNWEGGALYIRDESGDPVALVAADITKAPAYVPIDGETDLGEGLKQITVLEGTVVIAPRAFRNMTELRLLVLASTLRYLGSGIVEGCTGLARVDFRGTGLGWFCNSGTIGRAYGDAYVYGGANHDDLYNQRRAIDLFKLYKEDWRRGNYT